MVSSFFFFYEDLFGFPGFAQNAIKTKKRTCFLWQCAHFSWALDSSGSCCFFMCGLALAYGSTFPSIFQFFSWTVRALQVLSSSFSAKLPRESPRSSSQACAECVWQVLAPGKISFLAWCEPKPSTCAGAGICVWKAVAAGACWPCRGWAQGAGRQQRAAASAQLHNARFLWFMLSVKSRGWITAFAGTP